MEYCSFCCKPFKVNHETVEDGLELDFGKKCMKVCSTMCKQSVQYTVGFAHGFILFHVLNYFCDKVPGKLLTDSVSCGRIRKPVNKNSEGNSIPETSVKAELEDVNCLEDDVRDVKVFFDTGDCLESEQELSNLSRDLSELKHSACLLTSPVFAQVTSQCGKNNSSIQPQNTDLSDNGNPPSHTQIQCHFCHSSFPSGHYQALAEHYCEVHTKQIHLICDICRSLFRNKKLLKQHKKNVHGIDKTTTDAKRTKAFKCDNCSKAFSTDDHLQDHCLRDHSIDWQSPADGDLSGETLKNKVQLKHHKTTRHEVNGGGEETGYWCYSCNKEYPSRIRLQRHNQFVHSKQTAVDCTSCGKSFRNKVLLKHHVQFMHSKQTPQDCQVCGKTYRNIHLLKMHMKVVHKVKVTTISSQESSLQCTFCNHTFPSGTASTIANHLTECHAREVSPSHSFSCDTCGVRFKKKVYLTRHMRKLHCVSAVVSSKAECKVKKENNRKRYPCDKCGKTYTQSALSKHIRIYHSIRDPVDCDVCGKTLINSFHLEQHRRQHMPTKICHICGAKFKTDAGLRGHLAAHKGTKSHVCEVCGVGFVRKTSWQRHIKLHMDTVPFQCAYCPKTFKTVYSLNTHILAKHHRGVFFNNRLKTLEEVGYTIDKEAVSRHLSHRCVVCGQPMDNGTCLAHPDDCVLLFKCNYCELVVSHVDDLCQHLKKHNIPLAFTASTGNFTASWSAKRDDSDRDYTCQVCHKSFQRRENLTGHMKQHKEKAFACHICLKKFTYKCNMKNHLLTHSEDKPFQCELCEKAFKCKQLLNNHRLVHNLSESPFKCHICGKGLTRKFFLQRHYRQMHPGITV